MKVTNDRGKNFMGIIGRFVGPYLVIGKKRLIDCCNKRIALPPRLVKEEMTSSTQMILRIKAPDFLGVWEFQFSGRMLQAKMSDAEWISRFRNGLITISAGDALRAIVRTTVRYGFDAEVVGSQYEIVKVLEVVPVTHFVV